MNSRFFTLTAVLLVGSLLQAPATSQVLGASEDRSIQESVSEWLPSRTAWGDPNLQGVYTFSTTTPLERPEALADKKTYTETELVELERQAALRITTERDAVLTQAEFGTEIVAYNNYWTSNEKGRLTERTSLIVNPVDGRKPPLTEQARRIQQEIAAELATRQVGESPFVYTLYDTWEDHPLFTRCLARPMPRIGQSYNHGLQILQTPGHVVIYYESMHDARIIPLDGSPHLDPSIRQWNGTSRGHWEGDILVIDWRNFTDRQNFQGSPQGNMRFVERLKKIDANTISYEVTVHDPATWTEPWTFVAPWRGDDPSFQNPEDLYEFACHEGNYRMMENSLNGSRALRETYAMPK